MKDKVGLRGRVSIYNGKGELVWRNHNMITYYGRNAMAKLLSGGITGGVSWALRMGIGWSGMLGEPDPAMNALYYDADQDGDWEEGKSLIEKMSGTTAYEYPIPAETGDVVLSTTIMDSRMNSDVDNAVSILFKVSGLVSEAKYPINELGLVMIDSNNNETFFAFEPILNTTFNSESDTLSIIWELIF